MSLSVTADETAFYTANGHGPRRPTFVYRATIRWTRPLVRLVFRPQVTGLEHVPAGGIVLCANHLSGLDSPALHGRDQSLVRRRGRNPRASASACWRRTSSLGPPRSSASRSCPAPSSTISPPADT